MMNMARRTIVHQEPSTTLPLNLRSFSFLLLAQLINQAIVSGHHSDNICAPLFFNLTSNMGLIRIGLMLGFRRLGMTDNLTEALLFLAHIVGDIHQVQLHSVSFIEMLVALVFEVHLFGIFFSTLCAARLKAEWFSVFMCAAIACGFHIRCRRQYYRCALV